MNPTFDTIAAHTASGSARQPTRSLMVAIFTRLQRYRETPLDFEIDSVGIAVEALDALELPPQTLTGSRCLVVELNTLTSQLLTEAEAVHGDNGFVGSAECGYLHGLPVSDTAQSAPARDLSHWIEAFFHLVREVDGEAIDLLLLRLQGWPMRSIAQRLNIGLRLAHRMLWDVRQAWMQGGQ